MSKKKVLIVTQEMQPYTALSEISEIARQLPQYAQDNGLEVRILMPRFGSINERRHRLHEVVRLSGMNIIVDDDDYPLIIKVASLPGARMQVYFLDNEDFFKRKNTFLDEKGKPFEDNPDRMIFFCKGVLETVKKFGWPPNIIHCHGWMTSLIPAYVKTAYKKEALFQQTKVVYSVYDGEMTDNFSDDFYSKASINNLTEAELSTYQNGDKIALHQGAINFSDALIVGSENLSANVTKLLEESGKPTLERQEGDTMMSAYLDFYGSLMEEEVEG
ncbi:MAG: glycogen/starch synthase [Saprospiraceae bacterium]|nr:glycogen/starch synthase [Saprospiraceae bacterium]